MTDSTHAPRHFPHSGTSDRTFSEVKEKFRRNWGWLLALGILLIVGGMAAILLPVAASLAVTLIVGVTMGISGIVQAIHAFGAKSWKGRGWSALSALVYIVGAFLLLAHPLTGLIALTAVLIAIIGTDGLIRTIIALRVRPEKGWGWLLASGILSLLLAVGLFAFFPGISLTAIGIIAGITLMFEGWAFLFLAFAVRDAE